jgi:DUF2075 family protein
MDLIDWKMKLIESTRKAAIWEDMDRFIVTIGQGKREPRSDDPLPFRRDKDGLLILKESSWRYRYNTDNKEEMKKWAELLYHKHC